MPDLFTTVNQLSILAIGRRVQWVRQTLPALTGSGTPAGASIPKPSSPTDGHFLQNSPTTLIAIDLREVPTVKTCKVTVPTVDLTGTYTTIVDGNLVTFVAAAADLNALIIAWRDFINASAPTNTIVIASGEDSTGAGGTFDTLVIKGLTVTDYSLVIAATTGTGVVAGVYDASSAMARLFGTHKSFSSTGDPIALWHKANDALYQIDTDNFIERFDTAGLDRGYVELFEVRGHALDGVGTSASFIYAARVTFGPSVQETAT